MTFLHALVLGIIEGITEFLPVSSTGHLILASALLRIPETDFLKSFEIAIQAGAILAIAVMYSKKILTDWQYVKKVIVACLPTFVLGVVAYPYIKGYLLGNTGVVLWALFLGGIAILAAERWYGKKDRAGTEIISYRQAFYIGLFQTIAFVPGVSRSAATILGGLSLGLNRKTAAEFSFILAVPTMVAATGYDLLKNADLVAGSGSFALLGIGFLVSAVTAYAAVYYFIKYIQRHDFSPFGWYRIVVAMVLFFVLRVL